MSDFCLGECANCPVASNLQTRIEQHKAKSRHIGADALRGVFGGIDVNEIFEGLDDEDNAIADLANPGEFVVPDSADDLNRVLKSNTAIFLDERDGLIGSLESSLVELTDGCSGAMEIQKSPYAFEVVRLCVSPAAINSRQL